MAEKPDDSWKEKYNFNPDARVTMPASRTGTPNVNPFEEKPRSQQPSTPSVPKNDPSTSRGGGGSSKKSSSSYSAYSPPRREKKEKSYSSSSSKDDSYSSGCGWSRSSRDDKSNNCTIA